MKGRVTAQVLCAEKLLCDSVQGHAFTLLAKSCRQDPNSGKKQMAFGC